MPTEMIDRPIFQNDPSESKGKREGYLSFENIKSEIKELSGLESEKARREGIGELIDKIIQNLETSKKTKNDYSNFFRQLEFLNMGSNDDLIYDVQRSFTQEQVDFILNALNKSEITDQFFLCTAMTTHEKIYKRKEDGKGTVSELTANAIIKLIENHKELSDNLSKQILVWSQNIQMIDTDIRLNLLVTVLNHPGAIDEYIKHESPRLKSWFHSSTSCA